MFRFVSVYLHSFFFGSFGRNWLFALFKLFLVCYGSFRSIAVSFGLCWFFSVYVVFLVLLVGFYFFGMFRFFSVYFGYYWFVFIFSVRFGCFRFVSVLLLDFEFFSVCLGCFRIILFVFGLQTNQTTKRSKKTDINHKNRNKTIFGRAIVGGNRIVSVVPYFRL